MVLSISCNNFQFKLMSERNLRSISFKVFSCSYEMKISINQYTFILFLLFSLFNNCIIYTCKILTIFIITVSYIHIDFERTNMYVMLQGYFMLKGVNKIYSPNLNTFILNQYSSIVKTNASTFIKFNFKFYSLLCTFFPIF